MRLLTIFLLITSLFSFSAFANLGKVVATVDGDPITAMDLKKRMDLVISLNGISKDPKVLKTVEAKVLEMLIDEKLIKAQLEKNKIKVDQDELNDALNNIASQNKMSLLEFKKYSKSKQINFEELANQVQHQIYWNHILVSLIKPAVFVTDKDIEESKTGILKLNNSQSKLDSINLAEIVLFNFSENDIKKNLDMATQLVSQIRNGANFTKLAKNFSQSPSASSGGKIGWIQGEQLAPELLEIVGKLNKGDVTEPLVLKDSVRILTVVDKKVSSLNAKELSDEEIKDYIMSKKMDVKTKAFIKKMRNESYIKIIE